MVPDPYIFVKLSARRFDCFIVQCRLTAGIPTILLEQKVLGQPFSKDNSTSIVIHTTCTRTYTIHIYLNTLYMQRDAEHAVARAEQWRGRSSAMPKGKPHPRMSSSDDDEDDTTPLCELYGVQAAKTAKTAAAFKEKAAADKKAAAELRKQLQKRKREAKDVEKVAKEEQRKAVKEQKEREKALAEEEKANDGSGVVSSYECALLDEWTLCPQAPKDLAPRGLSSAS